MRPTGRRRKTPSTNCSRRSDRGRHLNDPGTTPGPPGDDPGTPPDDETPPPEDDPEAQGGHMIPEGKTRAGLLRALEWIGIDVRFNERSARLELQDASDGAAGRPNWESSDDMRGAKLREMVADTCLYPGAKGVPSRLQFGRERWGDVMDAVLDDRRVDPFKIWLDALPPWDGEARIDFWLGHVFTVGEIHEDLLRWASRSVLMGVVIRTDHPGEKHDEMVVLVGPQGIGKSTAWAWLLPGEPQRALWFSDGLSFHDDQKSQGRSVAGDGARRSLRDDGLDQGRSGDDQEVPQPDERQHPPDLPPRPLPAAAPLHDRRHDERPAVSAERRERESAVSAGAVRRGRPGRHTGLPRRAPRAAVGRSPPPGPGESRDRLPPRQPEGPTGPPDRAIPGGRRGRRGSHRRLARREPAGGHRETRSPPASTGPQTAGASTASRPSSSSWATPARTGSEPPAAALGYGRRQAGPRSWNCK